MIGKLLKGTVLALSLAFLLLVAETHAQEDPPWDARHVAPSSVATAETDTRSPVHIARLNGVIDPIAAQYLSRVIERAEREGAVALIVSLDTPGGLDSAMRMMTQHMLAAQVPIVIYVAPAGARAASAGMFLTISAHVAAMAPGTNIGAAHPVALGSSEDTVMASKMVNDAAATARTLASQRGRNADWADRAVRESISATETEALETQVIDLVARDLDDLLIQLDGRVVETGSGPRTLATRDAPRVAVEMTVMELLLHTLLNPDIAFILLNLGLLGLLAEFYHPGTLIPGISGVIALLLGFVALGTLPVNWGAMILLLLAVALFIVDVHVSAHGVLSVGGVVAFVLGGLLLFSPFDATPWQPGPIAVSPAVLGGITALFVVYFLIVIRASLSLRRVGTGAPSDPTPGARRIALAVTDLNPSGVVYLENEDWSAHAESDIIRAGEAVEVVGQDGLHLRVRRAVPAPTPPGASR